MGNQKKLFWSIAGYDGIDPIFCERIAMGSLPGKRIETVLQMLVARRLSPSEIIGGLAKKNAKYANELLSVRQEPGLPAYMCGDGPHYTAVIEGYDYDAAREKIRAFQKSGRQYSALADLPNQ